MYHATKLGLAYSGSRSEKIWQDEDVSAFLGHAGHEMALAMRLALDTVQRQGDLIGLTWSAFDGQSIALRQPKGDGPFWCHALIAG